MRICYFSLFLHDIKFLIVFRIADILFEENVSLREKFSGDVTGTTPVLGAPESAVLVRPLQQEQRLPALTSFTTHWMTFLLTVR